VDLLPVADALAQLEDGELRALVEAANEMVLMAAGFLSWIEHIADWELNRRAGLRFPLQPPDAAIPAEDEARSIAAALLIREQIADRDEVQSLATLFDAVLGALTGRRSLQ